MIKIKTNLGQYIFIFLMIIVAFSRSFYQSIFINSFIEIIILSLFFVCSLIYYLMSLNKHNNTTRIIIFFSLSTMLILTTSNELTNTIIFNIYSIFAFLFMINDYKLIQFSFKLIIFLSIIFSIVTWINLLFPNFYIKKILIFLNDGAINGNIKDLYNGRLSGLTNHYSRNAFYTTLGIIVCIGKYLVLDKSKYKKNYAILLIFLSSTLFIIGKRGHSLFLIISLILTLMILNKNILKKFKYILKILLVLFIVLLIFSKINMGKQNLFIRLFNNSEDISTGRFELYKIALDMFYKKPIFGYGYNAFSRIVSGFAGVHNDYIQLLCENGIVGLFIMLLSNLSIYFTTIITILKFREKKRNRFNEEFMWLIISFMFQTFYLIYSFTGLPHYDYEIFIIYYLFSGVAIGIYRKYSIKKII